MMLPLLLSGVIAYLLLGIAFAIASRGAPRRARVGGLLAILAAAPFFFWFGGFSERFTAGQCYSSAFDAIANAAERSPSPKALSTQIRSLPLHGYETDCAEVEQAARRLSGSIHP